MNNLSFTTAKIYAIALLIFGNQADFNSSMLIVEFHLLLYKANFRSRSKSYTTPRFCIFNRTIKG
ncbi:hypothetical protein COO91_00724 [Nostoc flagelliforme CCNUN1]|uniref:Uncharacterized protein n=1 Tax=Nostoc flagelliforme CCNUN1 TaxID=2038116 RepID=A0A2K8SHF9_9NOSO|nr:hypothetical protein [Nostoc flagelliforme]AUB34886.1 hypothetical protein COO91_00724 [Nostoc flagelliforme CCNUN1]